MAALLVLLGVGLALLSLAAVARVSPRRVGVLQAVVCGLGGAAALLAPGVASLDVGLSFAVDGLSGAVLAALFLVGACGVAGPVAVGAMALGVLAADGFGLTLAAGLLAMGGRGPAAVRCAAVGCVAAAVLLLGAHGGWPDVRFAAVRALPPGSVAGFAAPWLALGAAGLLAAAVPGGGILAVYLVARMLLDLAGPVTPGWWGVPVLAAGMAAAVLAARRAGASEDLAEACEAAAQAVAGLAVAALGVALLARGADVPPLAAAAVLAALLLVACWAIWGGLLLLAAAAVRAAAGTTALARLGGMLRRVPVLGLAMLVGVASMAAVPVTPGFAAGWAGVQALLGAGRAGGTAVLGLLAAGLAAYGLVLALLAAAAVRLAGLVLLGAARSARASEGAEVPGGLRLALGCWTVGAVIVGVMPWLAVLVVQPGVRLLAGVPPEGAGVWSLAGSAEAAAYSAPGVAVLLAVCIGAAAWFGRGAGFAAAAWRGGLVGDGVAGDSRAGDSRAGDARARFNALALVAWPAWRQMRPVTGARAVLAALALALAAALGWAAR